jgi:hypothetical protein
VYVYVECGYAEYYGVYSNMGGEWNSLSIDLDFLISKFSAKKQKKAGGERL